MAITRAFYKLNLRIKAQSGETLVETLVSLLISTFALLLLATAIASSVSIIRSSSVKMTELYNVESSMIGKGSAHPFANSQVSYGIPLEFDNSGHPKSIDVNVYVSDEDVSADETYAYYEKR